jgi:hypothetical protein
MPTAYTPGLKITEDTLVIKERRLPIKGEVLVKVGDPTQPDTVVARAMLEGNLHTFKAAEQLNLSPAELIGALKKQIGDEIAKDEILAETKGLFGLFHSVLRAPVAGVIEHIGKTSGFIGIRQPPQPIETHAYLRGKVTEILEGEGAIIETRAAFVQGIFGVGGERYGALRMAAKDSQQLLNEAELTDEMCGAVIVCGAGATSAALQKAAQVGVAGVVVGALPDAELRQFVGYDIGVAITGHEKVPFTLIFTEGFGEIPMAEHTFRLLKSLEGKTASINGATQIRAGVIRPEIIVPREDSPSAPGESGLKPTRADQLAPGVKVRLIREPYFGKLAEVIDLPAELQQIQTGAKVRVAAVKLENGEQAIVPRANLEIIQE